MKTVIGLDIGSLATKCVVFDSDKGMLAYHILRSGHAFEESAKQAVSTALDKAGINKKDIAMTIATGYGRALVLATTMADAQVTEITCHAKGVNWVFPDAKTVIDIGGQDSKVIGIEKNGVVANFVMNDKCAAGTGRFLEVMAVALAVEIEDMGDLSLSSDYTVEVSSMCTVFAESEVISLFAKNHKKADIAAGIADSIARRITGLVGQVGLKEKVVMSGGVAKNKGVVHAIEKRIGTKLFIAKEPQIIGALGAAIVASSRVS